MEQPEIIDSGRRRTATGKSYRYERYVVRVAMSDAVSAAFRPEDCARACMACPNYGTVWTCPPFDAARGDVDPRRFDSLELYIVRIYPLGGGYPMETCEEFFLPEKRRLMADIDRIPNVGAVYSFAGRCEYCSGKCARVEGKACRFPDKAHPSLEGVGFDVNELLINFAGMEVEWGTDGHLPSVLTFVAGIAR